MLVVCEGLDKCGKTTFIKNAVKSYHHANDTVFATIKGEVGEHTLYDYFSNLLTHSEGRQTLALFDTIGIHFNEHDDEDKWWDLCIEMTKYCNVFMDRSIISEYVYGKVYRPNNRKYLWPDLFSRLKKVRKKCDATFLLFDRDIQSQEYLDSLDMEDNYERFTDLRNQIDSLYKQVFRKMKSFKFNTYKISFEV